MILKFLPANVHPESIQNYAGLLRTCFPSASQMCKSYLGWLYEDNPAGNVIGFDAFERGRLIAHYAAIPTNLEISGTRVRGLLSLNTATHPAFQGQGLFTKLANLTYDFAASEGFSCVFGVANAKSTFGFTQKLGFQLVSPLLAMVGLGGLNPNWENVRNNVSFQRVWSTQELRWRSLNPTNRLYIDCLNHNVVSIRMKTGWPLLQAYGEIPLDFGFKGVKRKNWSGLNLFIGLFPEGSCHYQYFVQIPEKLKPSPLNFIYKDITGSGQSLDVRKILFSVADFDAY